MRRTSYSVRAPVALIAVTAIGGCEPAPVLVGSDAGTREAVVEAQDSAQRGDGTPGAEALNDRSDEIMNVASDPGPMMTGAPTPTTSMAPEPSPPMPDGGLEPPAPGIDMAPSMETSPGESGEDSARDPVGESTGDPSEDLSHEPTAQPGDDPPEASGPEPEASDTGCVFRRGDDPTASSISGSDLGPYDVKTFSQGFDPGAGVETHTVHYPEGAEPPFAGVAIMTAEYSPEDSIQGWGPFLASHGIVAVTLGVPREDEANARAEKLISAVEGIRAEHSRTGSPLEGRIASGCMAVSGWSMGGGGALIAVAGNPELKAGVSFAAWGPRGASNNRVPVLMFQATLDGLAGGMSDPYYRDTPGSTPKMLFEVEGGSHNVANSPVNQGGLIGEYALSWYKVFLEGDERYRPFLLRDLPSITSSKSKHNLQ